MRRVVVTGVGVVSPVGCGQEEFWRNLTAGRSGIGEISLFDASALPVRIGGQVKALDLEKVAQEFPASHDERDRKVLLGLAAAREAVQDAGVGEEDWREATLHVGVGLEVFFLADLAPAALADDMSAAVVREALTAKDGVSLQTPLDRLTEVLGDHYGIWGARHTNCSACAAGAQVIGEAMRLLRHGAHEVALVGASDSMLNPLGLGGFGLLGALSKGDGRPEEACRPFDANRQGTVLGEGAAFLVLETLAHALERGSAIYAEALGYGCSMDAFRVSDPDPSGRGAVLSMRKSLDDAGADPQDIDCVSAHGTGTPKNDVVETAAIKEALGPRAREIPVHSVKSMTGHMIAASGAVEAVAAVLTILRGTVPPTINLDTPDPECDLDYVSEGARDFRGKTVMSNSFGFGGQNATLLFRKHEE